MVSSVTYTPVPVATVTTATVTVARVTMAPGSFCTKYDIAAIAPVMEANTVFENTNTVGADRCTQTNAICRRTDDQAFTVTGITKLACTFDTRVAVGDSGLDNSNEELADDSSKTDDSDVASAVFDGSATIRNCDTSQLRRFATGTCKLRRVCHALRDFIDCVKPDSNLEVIDLKVRADMIFGLVRVQKSIPFPLTFKFDYNEIDDGCVVRSGGQEDFFSKNFVDVCIDDFLLSALKHQKSLLGHLCVTKKLVYDKHYNPVPQTAGKFVVPTFDKIFDGLMKVLESRNRPLKGESLIISVHGQDQLIQLLSHVDLKVLKSLEVRRLLETETFWDYREDDSEFVLDLDILKNCKNLKHLHVKRFSISSSFRMFAHIPDLKVNMQTIYCEDLLLFKNTMENSKASGISVIRFGQFPDKSRFLEAIGLAEDGREKDIVFPSKLSLTYLPEFNFMKFRSADYCWELIS
ncbi:hypothetical protein GCK72_021440 [Caenorhabditis remanei]|uniref:DUF38 domain-containing protein n=1 Tax=Caenorhabditis remanei TaxID=31234 RepID=A0A6A5GJZ5_CAERE|nr:hypothetical protein GCK72_021440 [Caenorhabditis remanei]KAF1754875.1 hypothetical protein GCK72_021440 [Caenorhabditis remanei]